MTSSTGGCFVKGWLTYGFEGGYFGGFGFGVGFNHFSSSTGALVGPLAYPIVVPLNSSSYSESANLSDTGCVSSFNFSYTGPQ